MVPEVCLCFQEVLRNAPPLLKRVSREMVIAKKPIVTNSWQGDVSNVVVSDAKEDLSSQLLNARVYLADVRMFVKGSGEQKALKRYLKKILLFPDLVCTCCRNLYRVGSCKMRDVGKFPNSILSRVFPDLTFNHVLNERELLCVTCWKSLKVDEMPSCCFLNKLELDSVDCPELKTLNLLEKSMLAVYRVCLRIITLPSGGQKASRGYCIQLPSDVQSLFQKLPVSLKTAGQLFVSNGAFSSNVFKVNTIKLRRALDYLICHHSGYKDVILDLSVLNELDDNGAGLDFDATCPENYGVCDPEREVIGVNSTFVLPELERKIISNKIKNWEACGFSHLYPRGRNDHSTSGRERAITLGVFIKNRVNHVDSRFRDDPVWLLAMANYVDQQHARSAMNIAGKFASQDFKKKDLQMKPDGIKSYNAFAFLQPIRGSFAFWQRHFADLMARFAMLGPPSFFVTLSANDIGWPDIICAIWKDSSVEAVERARKLSYEERLLLVRKNPVLVCQQMDNRFRAMIDFIVNGKGLQPLGPVSDFLRGLSFSREEARIFTCLCGLISFQMWRN